MKEIYKQMIVSIFFIGLGVALLESCLLINSFRSCAGCIASNSFFQVTGLFSQMFLVMFGSGCVLIGYGLKGMKPIVFHSMEG